MGVRTNIFVLEGLASVSEVEALKKEFGKPDELVKFRDWHDRGYYVRSSDFRQSVTPDIYGLYDVGLDLAVIMESPHVLREKPTVEELLKLLGHMKFTESELPSDSWKVRIKIPSEYPSVTDQMSGSFSFMVAESPSISELIELMIRLPSESVTPSEDWKLRILYDESLTPSDEVIAKPDFYFDELVSPVDIIRFIMGKFDEPISPTDLLTLTMAWIESVSPTDLAKIWGHVKLQESIPFPDSFIFRVDFTEPAITITDEYFWTGREEYSYPLADFALSEHLIGDLLVVGEAMGLGSWVLGEENLGGY